MKKVKITVIRMACYNDLMAQYENPIEHACELKDYHYVSPYLVHLVAPS